MNKSALKVFDAITPPQFAPHVGCDRAYVDTGAGFYIAPGVWLPSWWKDGWNGPKEKIDEDALARMADNLPERPTWTLNIWEGRYDVRNSKNDVEKVVDEIRNKILIPIHKRRPDIRRSFFASIPSEHYDITIYHQALQMKRRFDAGENIPNAAWWLNRLKEVEPRYKAWVNAVNRLTYGFDDNTGRLDTGGGLLDELDALVTKNYLVGDQSDGAYDALDIESDKFAITEQVSQAKRVSNGRLVFSIQTPYIEQTNDKPKEHRLELAMRVSRDAGADGLILWHYTGGRMPSPWEEKTMDMGVREFSRAV